MAMLNDVKSDLCISHNSKDTDITLAIESAKHKMKMQGVNLIDDSDELTGMAIKLFCRGWFNFQGDAERYNVAFDNLVNAMALSGDYDYMR